MPTRRTVPSRSPRKKSAVSKASTVARASVQPVQLNTSAPEAPNTSTKKMWAFVAGTTIVIVALWVVIVGVNLTKTSEGDESLYDKIKFEVSRVFGNGSEAANRDTETLSEEELQDLEQRVFPSSAQDSGTFQTLPE